MATARQARSWARRNKNFVTDVFLALQKVKGKPFFVELATGEFMGKTVYGVTVIKYVDADNQFTTCHELDELSTSKGLDTYEQASRYFDSTIKTIEGIANTDQLLAVIEQLQNKEIEAS